MLCGLRQYSVIAAAVITLCSSASVWSQDYKTNGGSSGDSVGYRNKGTYTIKNTDTLTTRGGSGSGSCGYINDTSGTFQNYGTVTATGGSTASSAGLYNSGAFINNAGAVLNANAGTVTQAHGFSNYKTFINYGTVNAKSGSAKSANGFRNSVSFKNYGTINATGGTGNPAYAFCNYNGNNNAAVIDLTNEGTINLYTNTALNALYAPKTLYQSKSTALISGNFLSFAKYTASTVAGVEKVPFVTSAGAKSTSAAFATGAAATAGSISSLANFLSSNISGGTIRITNTEFSESGQQFIINKFLAAGVGSNVKIIFGGTGTLGFEGGKANVFNLANSKVFATVNPGAVLYNTTMTEVVSGGLKLGSGSADLKSVGFKTVATNAVTVTGDQRLTLLGNGTQLAGSEGTVTIGNTASAGHLSLGFEHDVVKTTAQGGTLKNVTINNGTLDVKNVNGVFRISGLLDVGSRGTLNNSGQLSLAALSLASGSVFNNSGSLKITSVRSAQELRNTGLLSLTDISAVQNFKNRGTLYVKSMRVSPNSTMANGGTILSEKMVVDGALLNRNGTFVLGTAAVAAWLNKHADVAAQLKKLGDTVPMSVESLLAARAVLADSATVSTEDEPRETFAEPHDRLATQEGRLAFAGLAAYADNRAQLERQLQSGVSGLWADVIASQSEMDDYKANRSGIAVGLQGTNDAGLTFGVSARYSDGKLKGNSLASENWTSVGGSAYAAWENDDAFVSGFVGYDNLKTKGSDKLTNDVVSAGVKSGLKLDVGPVHVTPFVSGEVVHQKVRGLDAATTYRFPMGVGLSGQYETYGAWQVHPLLEVAFVPHVGDKVVDVTDKVDSRFAGNYAVESRLGIAVEKKNLMLGINYHGSAGDAGLRSHSLQANVRYRF